MLAVQVRVYRILEGELNSQQKMVANQFIL